MPDQWCAIAPIVPGWGVDLAEDAAFEFEDGLTFEPLPDWARSDHVIGQLSQYHRTEIRGNVRFALLARFEADADGEPAPGDQPGSTRQEAARYRLMLVNLAMWLARPCSVGFDVLVQAAESGGVWVWRDSGTYPRVRGGVLEGAAFRPTDFINAKTLFEALAKKPGGSIGRSVRALWIALRQHDTPEVRYLMLWLLLEALFGPNNGKKVSIRIPKRGSKFLSPECGSEQDIYQAMREAYDLRSRVIHGDAIPGRHDAEERQKETEALARQAMIKILSNPAHAHTFSREPDRDNYLKHL